MVSQRDDELEQLLTQVTFGYGCDCSRCQGLRQTIRDYVAAAEQRGWDLAHEPAKCGHARANYKDPKYGTPDYQGEEECEFCTALAGGVPLETAKRIEKLSYWLGYYRGHPGVTYVVDDGGRMLHGEQEVKVALEQARKYGYGGDDE